MKTLLLDNYDSFSHILFQYLWEVNGERPVFLRNDASTLEEIRALDFDNIVVSPGPGHPGNPRDFGVCAAVIAAFPDIPLLGVCLGHQGLGMSEGARVVPAPAARHGKLSRIFHDGRGIFAGIPQGFDAVRYHSLVLETSTLPGSLAITAKAGEDGQIMGISMAGAPRFGVQFHPESIGTDHGKALLANFRNISAAWPGNRKTAVPIGQASRPSAEPASAAVVPPIPRDRPPRVLETCELPWRDPEEVFARLFRGSPAAFWLDSLSEPVPGEPRITYMGSGSRLIEARGDLVRVWTSADGKDFQCRESVPGDPFAFIGQRLGASEHCKPPEARAFPGSFRGGLIGYFGYELKRFAGGGDLPSTPAPEMPDALFLEPDRILAFDPATGKVHALLPARSAILDGEGGDGEGTEALAWFRGLGARWGEIPSASRTDAAARPASAAAARPGPIPPDGPLPPWRLSIPKEAYLEHIRSLQEAILRGETYEACLTNELRADAGADPFEVYRILRRINPAPYAAFLRFPQGEILSASPERFLKLDARGNLSSRPIKGTRPRGATPEADEALRADLASNAKDRSENLMIVDLMRNDFGRICALGSVEAPDLMRVEAHPTVLQLVSTVRGRLAAGVGAVEAVRACFPGGSMTGAPKLRTMELLEALEKRPRGVFSGAMGYLGWDGAMDLGMVIRTLVHREGRYSVGCGGAILAESEPEAEFAEAMLKASALLRAVESAAPGTS